MPRGCAEAVHYLSGASVNQPTAPTEAGAGPAFLLMPRPVSPTKRAATRSIFIIYTSSRDRKEPAGLSYVLVPSTVTDSAASATITGLDLCIGLPPMASVAQDHASRSALPPEARHQAKLVGGRMFFAPAKNRKIRDTPVADPVILALAEHVRQYPPVSVTRCLGARPTASRSLASCCSPPPMAGALDRNAFNRVWRNAWRAPVVAPERGRQNGCPVLRHAAASAWRSRGLGLPRSPPTSGTRLFR
jgi:hypothetical protein